MRANSTQVVEREIEIEESRPARTISRLIVEIILDNPSFLCKYHDLSIIHMLSTQGHQQSNWHSFFFFFFLKILTSLALVGGWVASQGKAVQLHQDERQLIFYSM